MSKIAEVLKYGVVGRKYPKYRKVMDASYTVLGMAAAFYLSYKLTEKACQFILNINKKAAAKIQEGQLTQEGR